MEYLDRAGELFSRYGAKLYLDQVRISLTAERSVEPFNLRPKRDRVSRRASAC